MIQYGIPELPERICVETRFVARESANVPNFIMEPFNVSNFNTLPAIPPVRTGTIPIIPHIVPSIPQAMPISKTFADSSTMTDGPNPTRSRLLQTDLPQTRTIEIQCTLEQELADMEYDILFEKPSKRLQTNDSGSVKETFLNYVHDNTMVYSNGKIECRLCGEIKSKEKSMESHMAIHWGPKKLCYRCGIEFEHFILWKHHNCAAKREGNQQRIKCPHFRCAAEALSPAELYDHINEHCGLLSLYRCPQCRRKFTTHGEAWYHRKLHKKCRNVKTIATPAQVYNLPTEDTQYRKRFFFVHTLKGHRVLVKGFLSRLALNGTNKPRRCPICMKRCSNALVFQRDSHRCLKSYARRMSRKNVNEAVTNGLGVDSLFNEATTHNVATGDDDDISVIVENYIIETGTQNNIVSYSNKTANEVEKDTITITGASESGGDTGCVEVDSDTRSSSEIQCDTSGVMEVESKADAIREKKTDTNTIRDDTAGNRMEEEIITIEVENDTVTIEIDEDEPVASEIKEETSVETSNYLTTPN